MFHSKTITESSPEVNMDHPYDSITELPNQNKKPFESHDYYDYVLHQESNDRENAIKMDSNPSYGGIQGSNDGTTTLEDDVTIQPNPSYDSNLNSLSEDDGYIETNQHYLQSTAGYLRLITNGVTDKIQINPNPSYGLEFESVKPEDVTSN